MHSSRTLQRRMLVYPCHYQGKNIVSALWDLKVDWDDPVPPSIKEAWLQWSKNYLTCLNTYFPKEVQIVATQLHGFSDVSESAYTGVVYLRTVDTDGKVHMSLVSSKYEGSTNKEPHYPAQLLA